MPYCEECDREFETNSGFAKHQTHIHDNPAEKVELECETCGDTWEEYESQQEWKDKNFCSVECRAKWDSENNRERFDDGILPQEKSEVQEKISEAFDEERRIEHSRRMSGSSNPNWQGGSRIPTGANWNVQREKALERDDYECVDCGQEHKKLSVHHKIPRRFIFHHPFKTIEEHGNRLSNLVTVCPSCHMTRERN